MVLLGDKAQVKAHFSPFGDSVSLNARRVCDFHRMYHYASKIISDTIDVPSG
jgi:hypothetical protein